jgi:crotonobetainyl-CoA:carnitine CoA-transferase CaiB-like acyl-CoA transferase
MLLGDMGAEVIRIEEPEDAPRVAVREMIGNMDYPGLSGLLLSGHSIKLSPTSGSIQSLALKPGNNKEIYCELLGSSQGELMEFKELDIIESLC